MKEKKRIESCFHHSSPDRKARRFQFPGHATRSCDDLSSAATATPCTACHVQGPTPNRKSGATSHLDINRQSPFFRNSSNSFTMALVSQGGPSNAISREGSRTVLVGEQHESSVQPDLVPEGTLHLRGGLRDRPHVAWGEDVVDNEGLGRKKSKSRCVAFDLIEKIMLIGFPQFVVSTTSRENLTNRRHLNRQGRKVTLMRVLPGQADSITIAMVIAITWIGMVMLEREEIKEGTTREIEIEIIIIIMRMNGCQQEREKGNLQ
jgi:Protein phosphatase inhibitor